MGVVANSDGRIVAATGEVISAGVHLLEQQDDIYQRRLPELQREAQIGWDAFQQSKFVEGTIAMPQIREDLRTRHTLPKS